MYSSLIILKRMTNEVFSVTQKHTPKKKRLPCLDPSKPWDMNTAIGKPGKNTSNNLQQLFWKPGRNINQLRNTTTKTYKQTKNTQKSHQTRNQRKKNKTHNPHTNPTHSLLLNKNVHIMLYCFHLILHSMMTLICLFLPTLSSIHKDP